MSLTESFLPRRRLRRDLPVRHRSGPRLQRHVRAVRPDDDHVLLPQQAHDVRLRDR